MPLSYIEFAEFYEKQSVVTNLVKNGPSIIVSNTIDNLAIFEYRSDSTKNTAIDNIKLDITIKGISNADGRVSYNGIFLTDRTNESYVYQFKVNGATPNSFQNRILQDFIHYSEETDISQKINKITILIDRLSIINSTYSNNRNTNIRNLQIQIPISETSTNVQPLPVSIPAMEFLLNEANLYDRTAFIRVDSNNNLKKMSISYRSLINVRPLQFQKRISSFVVDIDFTKDDYETLAIFSLTRKINLNENFLRMQVSIQELDNFLNANITRKSYSTSRTTYSRLSPAELAYFGYATSTGSVSGVSFRDALNSNIYQYSNYKYLLYKHNAITGSSINYTDSNDVIRLAYTVNVGLSPSITNAGPNNPADLFGFAFFDVSNANLTIDSEKFKIDYTHISLDGVLGKINNAWSLGFTNLPNASTRLQLYMQLVTAPKLYRFTCIRDLPAGTEYVDIIVEDNMKAEELFLRLNAAFETLGFNIQINQYYKFLTVGQALGWPGAGSRSWQVNYNYLFYNTRIYYGSGNYFDGRLFSVPMSANQSLNIYWNDNPTLGTIIDAIKNINIRKNIQQYIPLFDYWLNGVPGVLFEVPKTGSCWRELKAKNILYSQQSRTFDVKAYTVSTVQAISTVPNCFVNINENSSLGRIANSAQLIFPIVFTKTSTSTIDNLLSNVNTTMANYVTANSAAFTNCNDVRFLLGPSDSIKDINLSYLYLRDVQNIQTIVYNSQNYNVATPLQSSYLDTYIIDNRSTIYSDSYTKTFDLNDSNTNTINRFITLLNNDSFVNTYISTQLLDAEIANQPLVNLNAFTQTNINTYTEANLTYIKSYNYEFILYLYTLEELASAINTSMASYISVTTRYLPNYSQAIPANFEIIDTVISDNFVLRCNFDTYDIPTRISYIFTVNFDLYTTNLQPNPNSMETTVGVQIALGGYEKDGIFYANDAPNAFFEPSVNTLFPIEFVIPNADLAYILVRTRRQASSLDTSYTIATNCYSGVVNFDNGNLPVSLAATTPNNDDYRNVWLETFGMPVVFAVPLKSYRNTLSVTDACTLESNNVSLINVPAGFNQVGFLAINKNNTSSVQNESKIAVSFGLVLDAVGAWDILISPNAVLSESDAGSILYDNRSYNRSLFGSDEAYDMVFNDLPAPLQSLISLLPIPNNPQVWALRISPQVKQLLVSQTDFANINSINGCFVTVDIKITGRYSQVTSLVRIKIYRDYTCVYDKGLCDSYWNLVDPPKVSVQANQTVENKINITIEELVDCDLFTNENNANLLINQNLLLTIDSIPTFPNGNALLLLKTSYESTLQETYLPSAMDLKRLRYKNCSIVGKNKILETLMNREFLLLPNTNVPIIEPLEIQNALLRENSYLYMRPQYQFPPEDEIKDCGENEIILASLGYVFKNWRHSLRSDNVVIGLRYTFSLGVYSTPQFNLCTRYYYSIAKT